MAEPLTPDSGGMESPTGDLALALFSRANLLIVGDDDVVAELVESVWRWFAAPVRVRRSGERLRLPSSPESVGTIVVHDVDTLTRREQRELYGWINGASGRTQVVSTASQSLLPRLEAGTFDEDVYYRLNVVTLHLTPAAEPAPAR